MTKRDILALAFCFAAALGLWAIFNEVSPTLAERYGKYDLDAGTRSAPHTLSATEPTISLDGIDPGAGVQSSSAASGNVQRQGEPLPSSRPLPEAAVYIRSTCVPDPDYEIEPGFLPSVEGLAAQTIDWFSDPSFLELTAEEARRLLPVDENIPDLALPDRLDRALVGGMPTMADVERAYLDPEVQRLLSCLLAQELALVDLDLVPFDQRTCSFQGRLTRMHELRDATALQLMGRMEKVSTYPHWRLLWRLRSEWAK